MRTKRTLVPGAGDLDRLQLREPEGELIIQTCRAVLCFELRLTIAINSHFSLEWKLRINPLSILLSEPHLLYKAFHKLGLPLSWCSKDAIEASQTEGKEFRVQLMSDTVGTVVPRLTICLGVHENVFNFF